MFAYELEQRVVQFLTGRDAGKGVQSELGRIFSDYAPVSKRGAVAALVLLCMILLIAETGGRHGHPG